MSATLQPRDQNSSMVYATVIKFGKDFTLVEKTTGQTPHRGSLCEIFNELEKDGYKLVGSGGAQELVFVFWKDGLTTAAESTSPGKKDQEGKKKK